MAIASIVFGLETGFYDEDPEADNDPEDAIMAPTLSVFHSAQIAAARREGLDIAEGDLYFFASDGSPLKAVFSKEPFVDDARKKYFPGVYSLHSVSGMGLQASLAKLMTQNPSPEGRIIVYRPDNDEDAQWYGWSDTKAMGEGIERALKILPEDMQKRVRFE